MSTDSGITGREEGFDVDRKDAYRQAKKDLIDYQLKFLYDGTVEQLASTILTAVEEQDATGHSASEILENGYPRHVPLFMLAGGIHRTAKSLSLILGEGDADSSYALARTLVERTINFAFLSVCEDSHFQDWLDYSNQKSFRLTQVEKSAGTYGIRIGVSPPIDPIQIPGLQKQLLRFTGKSGQERTRWTNLRLDDRLASIEGKLEGSKAITIYLLGALASTYDPGAEVQHGTLVGVQLGFGVSGMGRNALEHLDVIGLSLCLCLDSAIQTLAHFAMAPDWANEAKERMIALLRLSAGDSTSR